MVLGQARPTRRAPRNSFHLSPVSGLSLARSIMGTPASSPPWQPITFGGVASFARASFGRLLIVQFIVALLVAGSTTCFLAAAWFPVVEKAITRLPEKGAIRRGELDWTGPSPCPLAEATFLSIVVDVANSQPTGQSADVQLELRQSGFKIRSLLGTLTLPYPKDRTIALNRAALSTGQHRSGVCHQCDDNLARAGDVLLTAFTAPDLLLGPRDKLARLLADGRGGPDARCFAHQRGDPSLWFQSAQSHRIVGRLAVACGHRLDLPRDRADALVATPRGKPPARQSFRRGEEKAETVRGMTGLNPNVQSLFVRGSQASRRPSPRKFKASNVEASVIPGQTIIHQ